MLFLKYVFSLLALLGLVAAKKPQQLKSWVIIHQLDLLQKATQQLNTELDQWDKTMFGAMNVSFQTAKLLQATKNATTAISTESKNLHIAGALHVKRDTKHLMKDMKATVGHLASLKGDFERVELAETVLNSLIDQQSASEQMNEAILPKLPHIGRPIGRHLGRKIRKIFQGTIDEYKKMLATVPPNGQYCKV